MLAPPFGTIPGLNGLWKLHQKPIDAVCHQAEQRKSVGLGSEVAWQFEVKTEGKVSWSWYR